MTATLRRAWSTAATAGIASFTYASTALAQFAGETPDIEGTPDELDEEGIRTIITDVINTVLTFLALLAVIVIIIAGIRLIISQGDEGARDTAKKTIIYALIGLIIVLFARVIVGLVTVYLAGEVTN